MQTYNSVKKVLLLVNPENADTIGSIPCGKEKIRRHVIHENGVNIGNKVFVTAVEQYLTKPDINYECKPFQLTEPYSVAERFDIVVAPFADIFAPSAGAFLENLAEWVRHCKIPFFVLGCGIGCRKYDEIDALVKDIGNAVCKFLDAVYRGGGEVAVRGWITKDFLDRCMCNTAVATGCPSFYRRGSGMTIGKNSIERKNFAVALNSCDYPEGMLQYIFNTYPKSMLVDQEIFIEEYFFNEKRGINVLGYEILRKYGREALECFAKGRVFPAINISTWQKQLQKFSFVYGSRIHGTIMALYAGVPMKMVCKTARTKEMADYLGIPYTENYSLKMDPYEEYIKLDLSGLLMKYKKGFALFEEFVQKHGITYAIDDDSYWKRKIEGQMWEDDEIWNIEELNRMQRKIERKSFNMGYNLYKLNYKLNSVFHR